MTVLLVLATFLVFIALDYAVNRNKAVRTVPVHVPQAAPALTGGGYIDGLVHSRSR